jgi:hypothetical protein
MHAPISRRAALAGAAGATAALLWDGPADAAGGTQVYVLDPNGGGPSCTTDCASCTACQLHAANKLFRAGADVVRAHPGCRCTITAGPTLPTSVHTQLFASSGAVDRRNPTVAALLAAAADQHELPMFGDLGPAIVVGTGVSGLAWVLRRRHLLGRS